MNHLKLKFDLNFAKMIINKDNSNKREYNNSKIMIKMMIKIMIKRK